MLLISYFLAGVLTHSFALGSTTQAEQSHISVPVLQHRGSINVTQHAHYAAAKHIQHHSSRRFAITNEVLDAGFWYGTLNVGDASDLSLLIDTGSSDLAVNPGLYKPSIVSQNLGKNGTLEYDTVQEDGCGVASISYQTFTDTASQSGLVAKNQTLGNVIPKPAPNNGTITQFPHDGIVGYALSPPAGTQLGGTPFFQQLCDQGAVRSCRFGLAFGTDGTGTQVLGGLDRTLYQGELATAGSNVNWMLRGSVAINNTTVVQQNVPILLDSGTANIVGPPDQVRSMFEALGIQAVEQNLPGCTSVLFGYYPCDSPPKVGFQLGSENPIFNIEPAAFEQANNGGNNCTATVTGIDLGFPGGLWILGQSWFQGKYVDFYNEGGEPSIGVAHLSNPTTAGAAMPSYTAVNG